MKVVRRFVFAATLGVSLIGCARLIGAEFDGAELAQDAGGDAAALEGGDEGVPPVDAAFPDAAGVDPRSAGPLALWLSADRGVVTDPASDAAAPQVSAWTDQSGLDHGGVQGDPSERPSLVLDAGGGLPAVRFEAARQTCLTSSWLDGPGGSGLTAFVVARGNPRSLLSFETNGGGDAFVFPYEVSPGSDAGAPIEGLRVRIGQDERIARVGWTSSAWQTITARITPGTPAVIETFHDGVLVERSTIVAGAMPLVPSFFIGCAHGATAFADGDAREVLLYSGALPDDARAGVERYLATRWGL